MSKEDSIPGAARPRQNGTSETSSAVDLSSINAQKNAALSELAEARRELDQVRSKMKEVLSQVSSEIKALEEEKEALLSDLAASRTELEEARSRAKDVLSQTAWEIDAMRQETDLGFDDASVDIGASLSTGLSEFDVPTNELDAASLLREAERLAGTAPAVVGEAPSPEEDAYAAEMRDMIPRQVTLQEVSKASFPTTAAKTIFAKALKDFAAPDAAKRAEAARSLSCIHNELTVRAILAQLSTDPSPEVRGSCVNALTELGMKEGIPAVERALRDPASSVRLAAVRGLYSLAGVEKADMLVDMLSDEDEDVRHRAATCVGWLGQKNLAGKLVGLFSDRSSSVRRAAAEAAGNLRSRELVSALIDLLEDANEPVRKAALNAVERITGKRIAESFPRSKEARQRLIARWRQWWREETGQS
jgi:hypothetical protein